MKEESAYSWETVQGRYELIRSGRLKSLLEKSLGDALSPTQCIACGGELDLVERDGLYACVECGEVFDLRGLDRMEIDLEIFDRLLIYSLKRKREG